MKAILAEEAARLGVKPIPTGIMVEVPAAAIMAAQFAREADFFIPSGPEIFEFYRAELQRLGKPDPGPMPGAPATASSAPAVAQATPSAPKTTAKTHKVQQGETFFR